MPSDLFYTVVLLLVCRASAAPTSSANNADPVCSSAHLLTADQTTLVYKYKTEVKLSVVNGQYDLSNEITADVNINGLGDCNYAVQLRNVKITETKDEDKTPVTSSNAAQSELQNIVVRFRWVDGFVVAVEADASAKVDHVNFIKGVLSALQVYSPVSNDGSNTVREEDVLGVCTTRYKYSQKGDVTQVNKNKDLSTCSKDKLHLSSSPTLTSLLGPLVEDAFASKTRYICQTEIREKKIQSVKCKTIEVNTAEDRRPAGKAAHHHSDDDNSSEDDDDEDHFNDKEDTEISSKLISIKQELKLQAGGAGNVDARSIRTPVRQTLQFVPTASFDKSTETVSALVSKIKGLLTTKDWDQFAAAQFVDITNELRRMDRANLNTFKSTADLKHLAPMLLNTVYSHDPAAASLNFDANTMTFSNPMSVLYMDNPSSDLVEQIVQASNRVTAAQVPEFVGLAATILKTYKSRETNNKDASAKIKDFHKAIGKFLSRPTKDNTNVTTAVLAAYAQLGLYDQQVRTLAASNDAPLEVQYHALNAIRRICDENIDDSNELSIRKDLTTLLLNKLQTKTNKNCVRVWAFEALYTSFIYNPEEVDSTLGDKIESALASILNEPLNQVNGFIWSVLKFSSLDRLCPLRGLAARLRASHHETKQFAEQATLSSRRIQLDLPLRKNYRAAIRVCVVFENDRVVPSFFGVQLAFDGVRRETLRLPWIDAALIIENLDWNFADYFLRKDPLNNQQNATEEYKDNVKRTLPAALRQKQEAHEAKEEDPDPSVYLHMKLFGADIRSRDVTDQVQDILRTDLRTFARGRVMNALKELIGKNPVYRLPLEIGAASAAANGLTLYKSAQIGVLADLTTEYKDTSDATGSGAFSLNSKSALSFSLTLQREVSSPLASIGETVHVGALSNLPFEYSTVANAQGRTRELTLPNEQSTLLATDFQYALRTSSGLKTVANPKSAAVDPSCTPSIAFRTLGIQACLQLNPFRSIQLGSRPSYPITITINKDPSVKKWRIGWRFNAQDAPQYEVAVQKVGVTSAYPGLGVAVTKTGNQFDVKVLTGMKSFNVKGTQTGNKFDGKVFSSDNKEVMTTSGTLVVNNDGFKLDSTLTDSASKKEVLTLTTDILPNRGQGLTADIALTTPDKKKSFKIHFRGDLYKPNRKLVHINGSFNLADVSYNGKVHLETDEDHTRVELHRLTKLSKPASQHGHDFLYERKNGKRANEHSYNVKSHLSLRTPMRDEPVKVFDFKTDFVRSNDQSNATLNSKLDLLLMTRNPPLQESIELDYARRSAKTSSQARRLVSPEAHLKLQLKSKSNILNVLIDHRHRRSSEASKKGPETLPPTFDLANKIHITADSQTLLPDTPRPFAFDVLSDLDFQLLNEMKYKFHYNFPRRELSASLSYEAKIDKVTDGHLFAGKSTSEIQWENKQKKATATGTFTICTNSRTLKSHQKVDTNLVADKNDIEIDLIVRLDRQPKRDSPQSFISAYNVTVSAPKHALFQALHLDGNLTRQKGFLETYNSVAYRSNKTFSQININAIVDRNRTGDGSLRTHIGLSLPLKNVAYITHNLNLKRASPAGRVSHLSSSLVAEPVLSHYARVDVDRANTSGPPRVHVENQFEYLRGNGDHLYGLSQVDVHRWSTLYSMGLLKRNNDLLHKHAIGYEFSKKTRKVALSLVSPQLGGNPLSIIGELTIDRENRIGAMNLPQEVGVHLEFGTPLSNLTALHMFYNLPMFNKNDGKSVDASVGFKLASPRVLPVSFYLHSQGSLNTTLHVTESMNIGNDIAFSALLTAQYNPQLISQISLTSSAKFYTDEVQNSAYALFKQHQVIVRGIFNGSNDQDYRYDMDIGFDNDLLIGHSERTDGKQTTTSDIDAKPCLPTGKYVRCYKGDITVRQGAGGAPRKGTFDINWGRGTAKLDVRVPDQVEIKFDHTHSGRVRDEDFSSKTTIDAKSLRAESKGAFNYAGTVEKVDGSWNTVQVRSSMLDAKTGEKSMTSDVRVSQKVLDKRSGDVSRKINVNVERKGQTLVDWSSESDRCKDKPANVLSGICQTATFTFKTSNQFAQRLRQRLDMPADPKIASPTGQVTYDGTLNIDFKFDPNAGPNKIKLDANRLKEDAVDLDLSFQPRSEEKTMAVDLKATLAKQPPMTVKYSETRRSRTNFNGDLKYSFNANDNSAEKTYSCEIDRPSDDDVSYKCKGERTTLNLDIDRKAGKSKVYVDLNRFAGERIGYEASRNPQTNELDITLYTLVSSWNVKRQPGKSTTLVVKQKNSEVLRVEGTRVNEQEIQVKFSPSNVNLKLEWNNATVITLKQTAPQQRNLLSITVDRERIRHYLPSLRNQDRPSYDIDEPASTSKKPLVEIAFDSHVFLSLSQALDKLGSHNGRYGLDTIKKSFRLQIGDAPVTVYNTQHWKTHGDNSELPESYTVRLVNNANGNFIQVSNNRWDEHRMISKVSHSFDGGKTSTTDFKVDRDYAHQVGSMYFFQSSGYRNLQGVQQLRNSSTNFLRTHLMKDLNKTNIAELTKDLRKRLRSVLEVDYSAAKDIVAAWNKEPEKSFLRQWSARLGLPEFFGKYPTYAQASDRISELLAERRVEREQYWRNRFQAIMTENRLADVAERLRARREELIKQLSERAEALLDRLLPKVDQPAIEKRITDYVAKLLAVAEQFSQRSGSQSKLIFKSIDDATKGDENKWFRTLVADIDSAAMAAAADAESAKMFKKLGDSSKLFISNIHQLSRYITKRREAFRERVRNAIRHIPKAYVNSTNFEVSVPVGREPGSYVTTSASMLGLGSLLRNSDQAFDTIRSLVQNRMQSRTESMQNYLKALRSLGKRLFKRDPSLTPEFKAIISRTGDALNFHGEYIYLNPACNYILAHDFADLKFSFRSANGKIHSRTTKEVEVGEYESSDTGRVQASCDKSVCTINVPMHYGGRVNGALGDVRDRSGKDHENLSKWLLQDCAAATRDPPKKEKSNLFECANDDDDKQEFCENFVRHGLQNGKDKRQLLAEVTEAYKHLA